MRFEESVVHEETYKGYTIKLIHDHDPESPRNWDNVGKMVCWHRRYNLGDEQPKCSPEEYMENLASNDDELRKKFIILPLHLYEHGGITMSTGAFSCPWDSGQVGFIYCTLEQALKEWGGTDEEARSKATAYMESEVKTYDMYLKGDVVGWSVEDPNEEEIGAVWGYYPDDSKEYSNRWVDPINEAKHSIDQHIENTKELETQLCANI
jgi:hypothetical protein